MNDVIRLIESRRSIRKFDGRPLPEGMLRELCEVGRLAPSGANLQPLRFITVESEAARASLFAATRWAGYLPDGVGGPDAGEEPMGYIILLADRTVSKMADIDAGLAAGAMMIGALSEGVASCMLAALDREAIARAFPLPEGCEIHSVLAFGYPAMRSEACDFADSIRYFYEGDVLKVPKRTLSEVLIGAY